MKQWITLIAATAMFASCSKDVLQEESEALQQDNQISTAQSTATSARTGEAGVYVSGWEPGLNWASQSSGAMTVYSFQRSLPEYTAEAANGGAMMTFAKMNSAGEGFETYAQPQRLDFTFAPTDARTVKGAYLMADNASAGNVNISYSVPAGSIEAPLQPDNYRFQYFVLPPEFLTQKGLTVEDVSHYSYDQVLDLVNPK